MTQSELSGNPETLNEQEKVEQDTIYIMAQFIAEATTRGAVSSRQLAKEMYYAGYRLSPTIPSQELLLTDEEIKAVQITNEEWDEIEAKVEVYEPACFRGFYKILLRKEFRERNTAKAQLAKVLAWWGK